MKMNAPAGATSITVAGISYDVINGVVDVDASHAPELIPHGYSVVGGPGVDTSNRSLLINQLANKARNTIESLSTEALGDFASLSNDQYQKFWDGFATGIEQFPRHISFDAEKQPEQEPAKEPEPVKEPEQEPAKEPEPVKEPAAKKKAAADAEAPAAQ